MPNRFLVMSSNDFDACRAHALRSFPSLLRMEQAERGAFHGELSRFPLGTDSVGSEIQIASSTTATLIESDTTGAIHLVVPACSKLSVQSGTKTREIVGDGHGVLVPGGQKRMQLSAGRYTIARIKHDVVVAALRLFECDADLDVLLLERFLEPQLPGLQRLSDQIGRLVTSIENEPELITNLPSFRAAHEQLIALRLADVLAKTAGLRDRAAVGVNAAALRRAREFIDTYLDGEIDLGLMARDAGLSLRSMQALFRRAYDCTIVQFIQRARLAKARARLERSEPDISVAEIARQSGFTHLGRFAQAYEACFGELPRQTLLRVRKDPPR